MEIAHRDQTANGSLCPGGFVINPGSWYWISVLLGTFSSGFPFHGTGQVWGPGGVTPGAVAISTANVGNFDDFISCGVGWGVTLTSGYAGFPNTAGQVMTELCIETGTTANFASVRTPPLAQLSPGGQIQALYHCNELLGSNRVLLDATTNHYDMAVGSQGDVVVLDSPF